MTNKILKITRLGNPILRQTAKKLALSEISSIKIQRLISDIRYTNERKKYGMGIAAPQVGESLALSVIGIKPTPTRPKLETFEQVIINPKYVGIGRRTGMWEGCQSCGSKKDILYAKALRYRKIKASWHDELGKFHEKIIDGFIAQVFQHETDHLNGVLFIDHVRDTKSYMMADEFRNRIAKT